MFESQDTAVAGILDGKVKAGDVVVIRYEGPKGGPGMQEMLYPTSYLKSKGTGQKLCADHRRPLLRRHIGGMLCIGHVSPEAAEHGLIALVQDGDRIEIDIPSRSIRLSVEDIVIRQRRDALNANSGAHGGPRAANARFHRPCRPMRQWRRAPARGAVRDVGSFAKIETSCFI